MGKTDENGQAVRHTGQKSIWPPYAGRIRQQQEKWDDLGDSGQKSYRNNKEALEEDSGASEAIKEYLAQHNGKQYKPAYLVRGADLACSQGTCKRMMNLNKCHGVYIKEHAVVHELDCMQGDKDNITWFGVCSCGEDLETEEIELQTDNGETVHGKKCCPHIIGTWQEAYEGTKIVDNGLKKPENRESLETGYGLEGCCTITTDSFLVCRHGGIILPVNSGQDREVSPDEFDYETEEEREAALKALQDICPETSTPEADCGDLLHARNPGGINGNVHGSEYGKPDDWYYKDAENKVNNITKTDPAFDKEVDKFKEIYFKNRGIYVKIANAAGVPPELIAFLHYRENSDDYKAETFKVYLHNGQTLGYVTTITPVGKFFTDFYEAAVDAINMNSGYIKLYHLTPTSKDIVAMMAFAEKHNGRGYTDNGHINPYLYNGTDLYVSGKYESDGKYNPDLVDQEAGAYILISAII